MLPVLDKPAIQYVVEEAVASLYDQILLVTGRHKRSIEDHFDRSAELEKILADRGDQEGLRRILKVGELTNLLFVRQKEPRGLGDAVMAADRYLDGESFGLLLGDDICISQEPCQMQIRRVFEERGSSVVAVQEIPKDKVSRYGVVAGREEGGGILRIETIQEKPPVKEARSNLVVVGRYHFTPAIMDCLRNVAKRERTEVGLTPAIGELLKMGAVYAVRYEGRRYDIGYKAGWLQANIELGLENPEFASEFLKRSFRTGRTD